MARPKRPSRKELLDEGHKLPRKMDMTELERRQFMKDAIGEVSMKKMDREQLSVVVKAFRDEAINRGIEVDLIELGDYNRPITVAQRQTTMEEVVSQTAKIVDALPEKDKLPGHIKRRYFRKIKRSGLVRSLGRIFWGIDNCPLYELTNILEQNESGILTEVFDTNIQQGRAIEVGHKRKVSKMFMQFCKDNEITQDNLADWSGSCNARIFHGLFGAIDRGVEIHTVKIGKHTYDMSLGELLDFYLAAQQEAGKRHIRYGGTVINGVKTGEISDKTRDELIAIVENNPKLLKLAGLISQIDRDIWKPTINETSLELDGKEIATEENWWGLEVLMPRPLAGKEQKQYAGKKRHAAKETPTTPGLVAGFDVNLIENRSILKDRTRAKFPLIIRDALQRFTNFENAIAEYHGLARPVRIARTLLNDRHFTEQLRSKGYGHLRKNMHLILERAQSTAQTSGGFDRFLGKIVTGVYRAVLFFNPRVVMSQFTSVTNYGAYVSGKYMSSAVKECRGIFSSRLARTKAVEDTLEMSDIAWDRYYMGHSSLELGELAASDATLRLLTETSNWKNWLGISLRKADLAALAVGMEIAKTEYKDAQNDTITGFSATYWASKDKSFEADSPEGKAAITKRAEWLWHKSQPSWDKWSRSAITSDPSAIKRLFFLFRSFHEKSLTIMNEIHTQRVSEPKTLENSWKRAQKRGWVLFGYTFNTALRALIMAGLMAKFKDDKKDYIKDIITAPFAMMPVLGHILDASFRSFWNVAFDNRNEYRGEAIESLPLEVINQIGRGPSSFVRAAMHYLKGDEEKGTEALTKAIGQVYTGLGMAMGWPVYELKRIPWLPHPLKKKKKRGARKGI